MGEHHKLNWEAIRDRLKNSHGQDYWRSLDELAETEEFREFLHREFPREASVWEESFSRRRFLQIMGASLAMAGLNSCTKPPEEKIVPYVKSPELLVPGKPLQFATAAIMGGYATGILVTSHMGRPTHIEGNADHPSSLGAIDILSQASILTLYDPDRSQAVKHLGAFSTWDKFSKAFQLALEIQRSLKGAGLRILTGTVSSPTLGSQLQELLTQYPQAKWHQYEPVNYDSMREGALAAFGEDVRPHYRFDKADVILSLDADFLGCGPASVRYSRDFADRRRVSGNKTDMNRLYVIESTPTVTGTMADHRLPLRASRVEEFVRGVARELGVDGIASLNIEEDSQLRKWISAVTRDLLQHRGSSLVVPGMHQPPVVHALAYVMNHVLGNIGRTVVYSDPAEFRPINQTASLENLAQDMRAGKVDLLLILGSNPVYDAPVDLQFAEGLARVQMVVKLGLYEDETSEKCHWHIPESHYLETWSDARASEGSTTIMQPLISPLYNSKSSHEIVEEMLGRTGRKGYDIVTEYWKRTTRRDFKEFWQTSLNDGIVAGTASPLKQPTLRVRPSDWGNLARPDTTSEGLEINFRPDPSVWDGRFANNGWLQELPKPITKITWDNAAFVSPATAQRLAVESRDMVELEFRGRMMNAAIWVLPGHPDDAVTLHLGYGRTRAGKVGTGAGFNAYALRPSGRMWFGKGLHVRKTGKRYALAVTQHHHSMEGRHLVREGSISQFREDPSFAQKIGHQVGPEQTMYPPYEYDGYAWGMSIDLNACTGCNACVIACQSENNIPIVGKDQVQMGREMHWIRIDGYFKGDLDNPQMYNQPVTCMHCENAPCEVVCPVAATAHDSEGLNVMVYNRCVGTRYCSNNCPYKVRRFNFLQYSDEETQTLKMMRNPDVTVRNRGVMEKCSYCVQRISAARIEAKKENRSIRDGEVVTACQAACPSQAITFGDINDKSSKIIELKQDPRDYSLLGELNTKPRTTYMARLRNPNPELDGVA